jgi:aminopeptidase N
LNILLVDDNLANQKLALRILLQLGYRADVAGNGLQALTALAKKHYHLVFMDAITSRIYDINSEINGTPASIYLESTVAHEVGHQWFYALVGDDQLDDPWLDESLTQFITLQYYIDRYGGGPANGFKSSLEGRWARVGNAKIPIGMPVAGYQGAEYSAIVYGRGPLFFVALQDEMGNDAFDSFIKEYTETLSWGIAAPEYLQSLAETHCACDLQSLFDEWVY